MNIKVYEIIYDEAQKRVIIPCPFWIQRVSEVQQFAAMHKCFVQLDQMVSSLFRIIKRNFNKV